MATLLLAGQEDVGDLGAFLGRAVRLDPASLVRLRAAGAERHIAAYARLPFDVLVGRTVRGAIPEPDVTVAAADLVAALDRAVPGAEGCAVPLPPRRDAQWRGPLPPLGPWRRLDSVPVADLRRIISAGNRTFWEARKTRMPDPREAQMTGEVLLDHDALEVSSGADRTVLPLRVLHAVWRMGFLGHQPEAPCAVSIAGSWTRLAAPYGSAYRQSGSLGLLTP